jgi:hypothetical protein
MKMELIQTVYSNWRTIMNKKISIILFSSLLFCSVVSATSLWGTYKGNSIVKITKNGNPIKISDVPAMSYNGRTMIPIYLLKQFGLNFQYDAKQQTINVTSSQLNESTSIEKLSSTFKTRGVNAVGYVTNGTYRTLSFYYAYKMFDQDAEIFNNLFDDILKASVNTDATLLEIVDTNNGKMILSMTDIRSHLEGLISKDELLQNMDVEGLEEYIE